MIRHIILIKFKTTANINEIVTLKQSFESMPTNIAGVSSVEWGLNDSDEGKNKNYTHAVLMNFIDETATNLYVQHP